MSTTRRSPLRGNSSVCHFSVTQLAGASSERCLRTQRFGIIVTVDAEWIAFTTECQAALGELVEGRPEPFKALWSHADDVVIMGAFGGYERGWEQVSSRLDWASKGIAATDRKVENVVTVVIDDLAYTVDLEHMIRHIEGRPHPRTLRCTQVYRHEGGQWKVVLRHADELPQKDEHQGRPR